MEKTIIQREMGKPLEKLNLIRNFKRVIETRDINLMQKELYTFLHLYCGFIAHYDIHGFRATYSDPEDFTDLFIRHFDREHQYYCGCYTSDDEEYKSNGYTKAAIKREFARIIDFHKEAMEREAKETKKKGMFEVYLKLQEMFEREHVIPVSCDACGNTYKVTVKTDGNGFYTDFRTICCLFCGQQIKLNNKEVLNYVERTNTRETQPNSQTL